MKKTNKKRNIFLGINLEMDPSAAIVENGKVLAYSEEERHIRIKHAQNYYPKESIKYCLFKAKCKISDVTAITINWNLTGYNDGYIESFYEKMREKYPIDLNTINWQKRNLKKRSWEEYKGLHEKELKKIFGNIKIPQIKDFPHHYTHAFQTFKQSNFSEAICITIDGSGDEHCTVVWQCTDGHIKPIYEIYMPHSLGWFYAAITEYLGFQAYDGEYKVMGLAAYGKPNALIRKHLGQLIKISSDGIGYEIAPEFIHYGKHTFSGRYTDDLVNLLGTLPRKENEEISDWYKSLAYETQKILEDTVIRIISWSVNKTNIRNICVGGGVGLNVKLNSRIFELTDVDDVFAHPLCGDSGAACGSALLGSYFFEKSVPEKLSTLALGHEESNNDIENILRISKVHFEKKKDIALTVAGLLDKGFIVGWFQGRMEAGPRALGQRSILANPTKEIYRDKVNEIVKFREEWRPFCPSILEDYAETYFNYYTHAPFMIISFRANDKLQKDAPAIVHVDGTVRAQFVNKDTNYLYYSLINSFRKKTGVAAVLNTSFNIKGEPIVCSARDALRTFWISGIDVLAIGDFIVYKTALEPKK